MTKLETATHVCLIGLCCLAAGLLIEQRFFPPAPSTSSARNLVGQKVDLPGANWQAAPLSVVLQISSTCHFCQESIPFYQQLMATRDSQAAKVPVIVASADAVAVMRQYLEDHQVAVDEVLHSRLGAFHTGTPTIFIVDSRGIVKRVFVGELDPSGQKQLLSIVERGRV